MRSLEQRAFGLALAALAALGAPAARGEKVDARGEAAPARGQDKPPRVSLLREADRLPGPERQKRAAKALEDMRSLVAKTRKLVEQARAEKDIVKLNCVGEKVAQVQGLLKVGEAAEAALREAVQRKQDEAAAHEDTKVQLVGSKVAALRDEAEQCIGQLAFFNDEKTRVDVDVPKDLPQKDPTFVPAPRAVEARPPPASGY